MLTVYGANLSGPANKVRMVANFLGLEYEYRQVNIREGEHRKEEFLKLNPAGKVPAIDDDGFAMFESNAICKYLCDKNGSDLYPKDLKARAVVDEWIDFVSIHVVNGMNKIVFNRVFVKFIDIPIDERSLADGISFLERFLPVVDAQLGKSKYLASDKLTLADIALLTAVDPAEVAEVDLSGYSNLTKWRNEIKQQDFYVKCHRDYGEVLAQMASQKA